jgi:rfaE bifunctional protein kinase chain/domain
MHQTNQQLLEFVPRLPGWHVLVVGDLFLDEYIFGRATRLSREAPVPVLEFARRTLVPGGAANPAHNICALGGTATVVGLAGEDANGEKLVAELRRVGIDDSGLVLDKGRHTTTKTRLVAEASSRFPQQLARIDGVDRAPLRSRVEQQLVDKVQRLAPEADAILVSDYRTGVASHAVIEAVMRSAKGHGRLCTVDAQGSFAKYASFDLIKGNRHEVEATLGRTLSSEDDFRTGGRQLLASLGARTVLITRGAEGISVITSDGASGEYAHFPAANRSEVFDVTGAGDTVIAVATLALLAGADARCAARLANYAAGLVIRKLGNAVVTGDELTAALRESPRENPTCGDLP